MNHKILITALSVTLLGVFSGYAQDRRAGEVMISAGAGYSNLRDTYNSYLTQINTELPEFNGTLDYFVIPEYSIGVSVAYQSIQGNSNYNNYPNQQFTETVTRFNVSLRSLVYFNKSTRPGFYGGVRLGYQNFTDQFNPTNPNMGNYPTSNQPKDAPTIQAFAGVRAMITSGFSTYFELGTGNPYFAEMGFSFNFGGRPAPSSLTPPSSQGAGGNSPYVR